LYDLLINKTPDGFYILTDSAFFKKQELKNKILSPLKEDEAQRLPPQVLRKKIALHRIITFNRQSAEWGNGSVCRTFARLRLPLTYDVQKRKQLLGVSFRLFNVRARIVGINQIQTVYAQARALGLHSYSCAVVGYYKKMVF
jgi:hypothetical protein